MSRQVQFVLSGLISALFCVVYIWQHVALPLRQEQALAAFGELVFAFLTYVVCMLALGFWRPNQKG